ncbi:MAG: NADH-quinone oxidoreductase subunit C [Planctomycetes bacterium]|nr:NADH-quinone oxidoreductase subunit C [Planctomycetota bacterium]
MTEAIQEVVKQLHEKFGTQDCVASEFAGQTTVVVPKGILLEVMRFLRDEEGFDQLVDVMGVDYLGYPKSQARFGLVYPLLNIEANKRIQVKVFAEEEDMQVPSLVGLWEGAGWPEREAAEMFGFVFEGHPDLRRILLCDLYDGKYPLRKDYPLRGEGERDSFKIVTRETS